jgi:hypothetical protein
MKKFLIVLGSIFLAVIVLGALDIRFVAVQGNALDKESKAYADATPSLGTESRCRSNSLLLHRSIRITRWCNALQQIGTQKTLESTKPLVL